MKEFHKVVRVFRNQVPEYIREQFPYFIQFLEAYYEWLDEPEGAFGANKRLTSYNDIDHTLDEFVTYFKKEFMVSFPETHFADKRLLLKHIKDFYRAKGSEKSYRLLFNVLFESEVDFYYPHVDLLRPSNGKWQENKVIRAIETEGDPFDLNSQTVFGQTSGASAFVNNVKKIQLGPYVVYELELNLSSINSIFLPGEKVANAAGDILVGTHYLFNGINFSNPGEQYAVGDQIILHSEYKGGYFGKAVVTAVSEPTGTSVGGAIEAIQVTDFGIGYFDAPTGITTTTPTGTYNPTLGDIEIISEFGVGAAGEIISLPFTEYPGFFANDDGKLSWTDKIQDGFFYQQYSYVVYVNESIDKYRNIVKKLIHPAGLQFFGGFRTIQEVDNTLKTVVGSHGSTLLTLKWHSPDVLCPGTSSEDLPFNPVVSMASNFPLKRNLPNGEIYFTRVSSEPEFTKKIQIVESLAAYAGYSARSLDKDKFYHKPTELLPGAPDLFPPDAIEHGQVPEVIAPNDLYWDEYGNVQILHFENKRISPFEWGGECLTGHVAFSGSDITGSGSYDLFGTGTKFTEELFPGEFDRYRSSIIQYNNEVALVLQVIDDEHAIIDRSFGSIFRSKAVRRVFRINEKEKIRLKLQPEPTLLIKAI